MNKKRIILYFSVLLFSALTSLLFTFLYGSFQHHRYWDGTIMRVQEVEVNLVKGFFSIEKIGTILDTTTINFDNLFKSLEGKIPITVIKSNNIIYTNLKKRYELSETTEVIHVKGSDYVITIGRYNSPEWTERFIKWISHPHEWFTFHYDYITIPFITALFITYIFIYAILWRFRANYLSRDVLNSLKNLEKSPH